MLWPSCFFVLQAEREQKKKDLAQQEGMARHMLGQTDKTISFLAYVRETFMRLNQSHIPDRG